MDPMKNMLVDWDRLKEEHWAKLKPGSMIEICDYGHFIFLPVHQEKAAVPEDQTDEHEKVRRSHR